MAFNYDGIGEIYAPAEIVTVNIVRALIKASKRVGERRGKRVFHYDSQVVLAVSGFFRSRISFQR